MNKKDARAWIDFKATAEDVDNFIRETGAVVGIAKDGQRESKIYVGANFGIPVQTSTVDELGKRGLLRPCEGIQSSNKQFFEADL